MTYADFNKLLPEEQLIHNYNAGGKSISPEMLVKQWAEQTLKMMKRQLSKRNIGNTGSLEKSLETIVSGTSDVQKIVFAFLRYGTFVDMGVGRGRTLASRREKNFDIGIDRLLGNKIKRNRLHSKFNKKSDWQWYSKSLYGAIDKGLPKILAEAYGMQAAKAFHIPQVFELF